MTPLERMRLSLDGLSVGDAFGQRFFGNHDYVQWAIEKRAMPKTPWSYTDDTIMALSIVEQLEERQKIVQDELADLFGKRYDADPMRGYGGTAHGILQSFARGARWEQVSYAVFDGMGSMGNGAAMRVAPLGAYFAGDEQAIVVNATLSAEVTHAHLDGQAGAVAVALAASWAWEHRLENLQGFQRSMLEYVYDRTPRGDTRDGIARAMNLPDDASVALAVSALGNGTKVISSDTVPFALWCAAKRMDHFEEAMWLTVAGLGDRDTTCAMVGGIVALSASEMSAKSMKSPIPSEWLAGREPLLWGLGPGLFGERQHRKQSSKP